MSDSDRVRRMAWFLALIAGVMLLAGWSRMWPPPWLMIRCGDILRLREALSMLVFAPLLAALIWLLFRVACDRDHVFTVPFVIGIYFLGCGMGMHDPMNLLVAVHSGLPSAIHGSIRFFDDDLGHWVFWTGFVLCIVSTGIGQIRHPLAVAMSWRWTAFYLAASGPVAFVMLTNLIWERTAGDVAVIALSNVVIGAYHLGHRTGCRRLPVLCIIYPACCAAVAGSLLYWLVAGYGWRPGMPPFPTSGTGARRRLSRLLSVDVSRSGTVAPEGHVQYGNQHHQNVARNRAHRMNIIDLTLPIPNLEAEKQWPDQEPVDKVTTRTRQWHIQSHGCSYTARVHFFDFWSMSGTYLDLPGHIVDTDDGVDAATVSPERFYRVASQVIRMDRADRPGPVSAADLEEQVDSSGPFDGLVLNALGDKRFDQVPERSVYLGADAVTWIVERGVGLLVSDVYESDTDPQNVFPTLFAAGIVTVCCPRALNRIQTTGAWISAFPLCVPRATQVPCRLVAEERNA